MILHAAWSRSWGSGQDLSHHVQGEQKRRVRPNDPDVVTDIEPAHKRLVTCESDKRQATLRVSPDDSPGWSDALREVRDDAALRADLIAKGRERLNAFSWKRAAEETASVYRLAAGRTADAPAPATGSDPTLARG